MTDLKPDAVRSPLGFAGTGAAPMRLARLQSEFAAILQVSRVYVRHQGNEHFITGDPNETLYHSSHDPRSGAPRYEWHDRGDGVLYGYCRPDE